MKRPWIAITWFTVWGLFQAFVVFSLLNGTWERPEAFPERAYNAFVYPDLVFIPLHLTAALLLLRLHWLGPILGLVCGGAVTYVLIYLFPLAGFQGVVNIGFDSLFLGVNLLAVLQIISRMRPPR